MDMPEEEKEFLDSVDASFPLGDSALILSGRMGG
jgi:hypothetical protein